MDPARLMERDPDPWLYFYEDFLAAYDPRMREERGVYYTPVQVVRCQVRLVGQLLVEPARSIRHNYRIDAAGTYRH